MTNEIPFTVDYFAARDDFRAAAKFAGARLAALPIAARGPQGEELTVDIAWLGDERPRGLVVHSCGVHGVEGFAGSPIQRAILRGGVTLPPRTGAVFVHGVNPYGMAWLRRWNEENIDLNRNCRREAVANLDQPPEGAAAGYSGAPELYEALNPLLNPPALPGWFDVVAFYPVAAWHVLRSGFTPLKKAIAEGQYEYPQGLFFGGRRLAESPRAIFRAIAPSAAEAKLVIACDVHTGLGPYSIDSLLIDEQRTSETCNALLAHFGERISPPEADVAYVIRGGFPEGVATLAPHARFFGLTQEFGTYSGLTMLKALREENAWHHHGDPQQFSHPAKQWGLRAFVPDDPDWQREIVRRGVEVFGQAVALAGKGVEGE